MKGEHMKIKEFGKNKKGDLAKLYIFENQNGMELHVSDFGATLQKLIVQDKNGVKKDIVLGYDNLDGYIFANFFIGSSR